MNPATTFTASGLNFIVLFTGFNVYNYSNGYNIANWMVDAQQRYGSQFLGIYKIDEPGGNQLDNGPSQIINDSSTYSQTAQNYVGNLSAMINPITLIPPAYSQLTMLSTGLITKETIQQFLLSSLAMKVDNASLPSTEEPPMLSTETGE